MIKLMIKYESSFIREFVTEKDSISIGRRAENDIVLDNPTISGKHCKIYRAGDSYFIEDLNSTNGTFVNSKKIIKSGLKSGDLITITRYTLAFSSDRDSTKESPVSHEQEKILEQTTSKYINQKNLKASIEVIENPYDNLVEYEIKATSTYIGKHGRANIPARSTNIFSSMPELAAAISFRADGYYLNPLKEGIVKHNGDEIRDKVILKDGDIIVVGSTRFKFNLKKNLKKQN